ncbi:hypothetical protein GOV04_02015 [Candidatus Woesearchaeota archaeon]|nr:hypothetical protein [Candidatus Woesearchaeota archaeon]
MVYKSRHKPITGLLVLFVFLIVLFKTVKTMIDYKKFVGESPYSFTIEFLLTILLGMAFIFIIEHIAIDFEWLHHKKKFYHSMSWIIIGLWLFISFFIGFNILLIMMPLIALFLWIKTYHTHRHIKREHQKASVKKSLNKHSKK